MNLNILILAALLTATVSFAKTAEKKNSKTKHVSSKTKTSTRSLAAFGRYEKRLFEGRISSESKYIDGVHFYIVPTIYPNGKLGTIYLRDNYDYEKYKADMSLDPNAEVGAENRYHAAVYPTAKLFKGINIVDLPDFIPMTDPVILQADPAFDATLGGKVYIHFLHKRKLTGSDYRTLTLEATRANDTFEVKCVTPAGLVDFETIDIEIGVDDFNLPNGVKTMKLKGADDSTTSIAIETLPHAPN